MLKHTLRIILLCVLVIPSGYAAAQEDDGASAPLETREETVDTTTDTQPPLAKSQETTPESEDDESPAPTDSDRDQEDDGLDIRERMEEAEEPDVEENGKREEPSRIQTDERQTFAAGDDSVLYYTYIGPCLSSGFHTIDYRGWHGDSHRQFTDQGFYVEPGALCFMDIPPFITQVSLGFRANVNEQEVTQVHHTSISARGRYMYEAAPNIYAGGGLGFYFESIPASASYDGAGALLCASGAYRFNSSWMLLFDLDIGFGNFGVGEGSTKIQYGITAGAGTKMGNL
ncbi:MAG: hypothetical protein ACOC2H_09050 [Spirochaetota bacterium]